MGIINAYRDSSDPKLVHIVPSGFQSGETSNINVRFNLTGYDEKVVSFTAQDTITAVDPGQPSPPPVTPDPQPDPVPPVTTPSTVEVTPLTLSGFTDGTRVINVVSQGDFTASSDNSNVRLDLDQVQRTITVSVVVGEQMSNQEGNITIHIDGMDDYVLPFSFGAIEDITISAVPTGMQQYVDEPIKLSVRGTTREVSCYASDPAVTVQQEEKYVWNIFATSPCNDVTVGFAGEGVKSRTKTFNFAPQETPSIAFTPASGPYRVGTTVTLDISGVTLLNGLQVTSSNPDLPITKVSDTQYTMEINEVGVTTINIVNRGVKSTNFQLTSVGLGDLTATPSTVEGKINVENRVVISGQNGLIQAVSSDPSVTVQVSGGELIINATTPSSANITVSADGCNDLIIPVVYGNEIPIVGDLDVASGTCHVGESYIVRFRGSNPGITYTVTDPRIKVEEISPNEFRIYSIGSEGFEAINGEVVFSAPDREEIRIPIEFQEVVQFTVDSLEHTVAVNNMPYRITVNNLVGELFVKSSHPKLKAEVDGNIIILTSTDVLKEFTGRLTLSVQDQETVYVNVTVTPPVVLPEMKCSGTTKRILVGETGIISIPLDDGDDNISCSSSSSDLTATYNPRRDGEISFTSNVEGNYIITINHAEYQPAKVYVEVYQQVPVVIPTPPEPDNYYDLGVAPEVTVTQPVNEEVTAVLQDAQLTSDNERIAYILVNGTFDDKIIAHSVCSYSTAMDPSQGYVSVEQGGQENYRLYNTIKSVLDIEDFYSFQERFKLLIRLFKYYGVDALSTLNLMRFEDGWKWGEVALKEYQSLVAFLTEYVRVDGQNVSTANLLGVLDDDTYERIKAYSSKNIRP